MNREKAEKIVGKALDKASNLSGVQIFCLFLAMDEKEDINAFLREDGDRGDLSVALATIFLEMSERGTKEAWILERAMLIFNEALRKLH